MRRFLGLGLVAMCVPLLLTGCRRGETGPARTGTPTVAPTPDPRTVVWALASPPATLDAARIAVDPSAIQVSAQVYDRLVRYRPGSTQLAPGIAEDWDADVDGRSFTFTLRPGLTFHDGTPLDARAVVWNFQRWMDPGHPAHRDDFVAWQSLLEAAQSGEEHPGSLVKQVEAIDSRTVRITLNAPFAPFLHILALVPFGLESPHAVRAQGEAYGSDGDHLPVGSGPFKVVAWSDDGTVRLVPFDDFWAGRPVAPGLRFVTIPDAEERAAAVQDGRVHGAELPPTFDIRAHAASGVRYVPRPSRSTAWLMLNHSRSPLDDVRVRKAISLAIDREELAASHFGAFSLPAGQILPPGFLGHADAISPPQRDLEQAKALLAEAEATDLSLIIWVANEPRPHLPDPQGTAETVAAMLREAGIDASVRTESLRQFLSDRDRGRFTAWLIGWEAQTADPDNFWFFHFWTSRVPSEGQYDNRPLAQRLLTAQRTLSADERVGLYEQSAADVDRDVARVFLVHTRPVVAVSNRLEGYEPGPMGFDSFVEVSVPVPAADLEGAGAPAATPVQGTPGTPTEATGTPGTPAENTVTPATPAEGTGTPGTPTEATGTPATPAEATGTPATPTEATGTPATPTEGTGTPAAGASATATP